MAHQSRIMDLFLMPLCYDAGHRSREQAHDWRHWREYVSGILLECLIKSGGCRNGKTTEQRILLSSKQRSSKLAESAFTWPCVLHVCAVLRVDTLDS